MRSHVRPLLIGICFCIVVVLVAGATFMFASMGGVSVSVTGAAVTITNSGLPVHHARVSISDGPTTISLPMTSVPRGTTTVVLAKPVAKYAGATIEGDRLGMDIAMYFADPSPMTLTSSGPANPPAQGQRPPSHDSSATPNTPITPITPVAPQREATAPEPK